MEEDISYAEPARPAPQLSFAQPNPQPAYRPAPQAAYRPPPQPQPAFRPAPQVPQYQGPRPSAAGGRSGGILDQLAKDYALPSDSPAALHDISFGYY